MHDFLQRFAEPAASNDTSATQTSTGYYKFSNVRSGLIVGLVGCAAAPAKNHIVLILDSSPLVPWLELFLLPPSQIALAENPL